MLSSKFGVMRLSLIKEKKISLPLLLVLAVSLYLLLYVWPTNINGDGALHAYLARKMVENGGLLDHIPFAVDRVDSGKLTYEPILYPETAYFVWSIFYILGGEQLLKLSTVLFGALSALTVFVLLRDIDKCLAFFAGFGVVAVNTLRFIMTPLMEHVFLFTALLTILYYYRSLRTRKLRYFVLTGVFLGFSMGIKQQGLLLFVVIFLHVVSTMGYLVIKKHKIRDAAQFAIVLSFSIVVSAAPLCEQLARTGTVVPSGSLDFLPFHAVFENFMKPKVPVDYDADKNLSEMLATEDLRMSMGLDNVVQQYLLTSVLYTSSAIHYPLSTSVLLFALASPLYLIGGWFLAKKDKQLFLLLLSVFFMEFLSTILWRAEVYKYNALGLAVISILFAAGVFHTHSSIKERLKDRMPAFHSNMLSSLFVLLVLAVMVSGNFIFAFRPYWMDEGRQTDAYLNAYHRLKDFIERSDTPSDAVFLAPQGNFIFICERDALWISSYGGAMVPTIFGTANETEALHWLQTYNVSFIVIDIKQTQRKALYDYIPSHGLLDYINNSTHFKKIFSYPSQEELLMLYKVTYEEG